MDRFLRRATPVVLLVLAGLAWFGPFLPGNAGLAEALGDGVVLRFVVGLLCVYMILLVLERQRLEDGFREVLGAFRNFHAELRSGAPEAAGTQRETVEILVAALQSADGQVRRRAASHLQQITGESLGEDPAAWLGWLAQRHPEGEET